VRRLQGERVRPCQRRRGRRRLPPDEERLDRDLRGGAGPVRHAYLILVVLALAACGGSSRATFTNPVFDRDFPDPFVLKAGDTYYAYATNGNGKQVQTLTSKDLVHWAPGPDALPKLGSWA